MPSGPSPDPAAPAARAPLAADDDALDLFETAPCGYLSTDPAGVILRVNRTLAAWLGLDPSDLVGRRLQDLLGVAGKIYHETHVAPLLRLQGFVHEVALDLVGADGRKLPVFVNAVERRDAGGAVQSHRITVFNASDRRRYESELVIARREAEAATEKLRDLNMTLERRVQEAVAERMRAEEQLRQSQKMEAMGQVTGGVAHDFNNLLTPILVSLDVLRHRGLGGEREHRLIDGALQSAERARVLVQRLLAFARRQPLRADAVDVAGLVRGLQGLLLSTLGPRVALVLDLPEGLPPARADANQLEMALLNLAVNARDAMPEGGTLAVAAAGVTVAAAGHPAGLRPGAYLRLAVRDSGTGMDAATLARAVEPFFTTKGPGQGTGLGLSTVHGLARQLGGGMTIDSRPGEGTMVALWLPLGDAVPRAEPPPAPVAPRDRRGTALLVDDEDLVRTSTAALLAHLGFEVVEAPSAEAAQALLDGGLRPDLVVTDHLMTGRSGADFALALRALAPALPILIVSGCPEVDLLAPAIPRLAKPFRLADLAAALADLLPPDPA